MTDVTRPFLDMPNVPDELWEKAKNMFCYYLFVKPRKGKSEREAVCSSCGKKMVFRPFVCPGYDYDPALFYVKQGDVVECPCCHRRLIAKDYSRSRRSLGQTQYFVFFLPVSFDLVYVRAFGMNMYYGRYCPNGDYTSYDHVKFDFWEEDRYVLEKGFALQERYIYGYSHRGWSPVLPYKDPFADDFGLAHRRENYTIFCSGSIDDTFLKYSAFDRFAKKVVYFDEIVRYLCWYAQHPMIEYFVKTDKFQGVRLVRDLIYGSPNKKIVNWDAQKVKDVWNITPEEYRIWVNNGGKLQDLKTVMSMGKPTQENFALLELLRRTRHSFSYQERRRVAKYCKEYGFSMLRLLRYLIRVEKENPGCSRCPAPDVFITWDDYMSNAIILNYDLKNPVVFMPNNLFEAHDVAYKTVELLKEKEEMEEMSVLTSRLKKRYAYENETFAIVVPESIQEIIREGKLMRHCVGGYATRHARGETVILFLRQKQCISVPFVTIEMHGSVLRQKQAKGNTCVPLEAQKFIDEWLVWLTNSNKKTKKKEKVNIA